jgi:hypothetical protein
LPWVAHVPLVTLLLAVPESCPAAAAFHKNLLAWQLCHTWWQLLAAVLSLSMTHLDAFLQVKCCM